VVLVDGQKASTPKGKGPKSPSPSTGERVQKLIESAMPGIIANITANVAGASAGSTSGAAATSTSTSTVNNDTQRQLSASFNASASPVSTILGPGRAAEIKAKERQEENDNFIAEMVAEKKMPADMTSNLAPRIIDYLVGQEVRANFSTTTKMNAIAPPTWEKPKHTLTAAALKKEIAEEYRTFSWSWAKRPGDDMPSHDLFWSHADNAKLIDTKSPSTSTKTPTVASRRKSNEPKQ
jgi:hypothetical protein